MVRRPGGDLLCPWRQSRQNATGGRRRGELRSPCRLTPGPPLRGTRTCWILQYFRRAKSERLFTITSGPLGPGFAKITAGAVPLLRLALPSRCLLVHCLRAGLGPAPALKTGGFQICRRGGCPHPPVPNRVSFLGGPASVRPLRKEGTALVFNRRGGLWPPESLPPSRGKVAREA